MDSPFGVAHHGIQSASFGTHRLLAHLAAQVRRTGRGVRRDRLGEGSPPRRSSATWTSVESSSCGPERSEPFASQKSAGGGARLTLKLAGCPVGRTSAPDAFSRHAVFGDHRSAENPAPAAGAAAAASGLPAAGAPRPDGCWADKANTPITVSGRRMYITNAMVKKFPCLDGLSQMPGRSRHAHTRVSSTHAQQHGVARS